MAELTIVADFTLKDVGVPSAEDYPQLWLARGGSWLLGLTLPGPGHADLANGAGLVISCGAGQIATIDPVVVLGERTHLVGTVAADGHMRLYVNGALVLDGSGAPVQEGDTKPTQTLVPVRMTVVPSIELHDIRTYSVAFSPEDVMADLQRPLSGWVWRKPTVPWLAVGLSVAAAAVIVGLSARKR